MITCVSSGGLGNQLFRFFAALNYSLLNNHDLAVDVSGFSIKNERDQLLVKREFGLSDYAKFSEFAKVKDSVRPPANWHYRLAKLPPFMRWGVGIVTERNYNFKWSLFRNSYAIDDFQSLKFLPAPGIILEFFDSLQERPDWLSERIRTAQNVNPVFIHLRLTDYLNFPEIFPIPKAEYYVRALEHIKLTLNFSEVWLFSDDPKAAVKYLGSRIENLRIADVPHSARPSDVLEMMSHGAGLVIGNSTFSWWSAYLARLRNPKIQVVMPSRFTNLLNDSAHKLMLDEVFSIDIDDL